jgi:hypothetical protein
MVATTDFTGWDNFEAILANCWEMLSRGVTKARDPFHTPVLGTATALGCSLRTVVLRRVIRPQRLLICHTDRRSDKVRQIEANSRVSWLFYHPRQKVQLRLVGPATLHTNDALADEQWAATSLMSRRCYCAEAGPGTPSPEPISGLPDSLLDRTPTLAESEAGRENFVVVAGRIDYMDWLYLQARGGHRRARFIWGEDGYSATWVAP